MIGRRGLIQAAFSTKEARELSIIENVDMFLFKDEVESSMNEESKQEMAPGVSTVSRGMMRRTDFLIEKCKMIENNE